MTAARNLDAFPELPEVLVPDAESVAPQGLPPAAGESFQVALHTTGCGDPVLDCRALMRPGATFLDAACQG